MILTHEAYVSMQGYECVLLEELWKPRAHLARKQQYFYRVNTNAKEKRGKNIVVSKYGIGVQQIDHDVVATYDSAEELPEWMQRKLAVLVTIPFDIPTEELEGIGRRVSQHVYWVYASLNETIEGDSGGTNTRTKSKGRRKKAA